MTENTFQIFIIIVDIKDNFENAEILIENDLMDYKNRYFFESVKIISSNINISNKTYTISNTDTIINAQQLKIMQTIYVY